MDDAGRMGMRDVKLAVVAVCAASVLAAAPVEASAAGVRAAAGHALGSRPLKAGMKVELKLTDKQVEQLTPVMKERGK